MFSHANTQGSEVSRDQFLHTNAGDLWLALIKLWEWFVKNSTPLFTILEGFCSLLFFQFAGRLSSWLIRTKSDSWIIGQLLASSCTFSCSMYFLYRIYTFPAAISLASASLIGLVLTIAISLALYGIISGRGNSMESSLLFAYIVYCLYFTFTDFQSSLSSSSLSFFFSSESEISPVPPVLINGYTNFISSFASLVPSGFSTVFQFLRGAVSTVTPSVIVSLSYRLGVFFAATQIIPEVQEVSYSRRNSAVFAGDVDSVASRGPQSSGKHMEGALDEDDQEEEDYFLGEDEEDEDEDTIITQYGEQLDSDMLRKKLGYHLSGMSSATTIAPSLSPITAPSSLPYISQTRSVKLLLLAYAPCILIAVYTHLLIQHLSLFKAVNNSCTQAPPFTSTNTMVAWTWFKGEGSPHDSWQFWGWVNMFSTLFLYFLELAYGQETNREEIIENHWNKAYT